MKERPILFSPPMVRKILAGQKTQTRRVVTTKTVLDLVGDVTKTGTGDVKRCPYGVPGDRLWVKEGWSPTPLGDGVVEVYYRADDTSLLQGAPETWKRPKNRPTALFMPRWASRILLELTEVRVQRIKSITEEDSIAEGAEIEPITAEDIQNVQISDMNPVYKKLATALGPGHFSAKFHFQQIWDEINGKRAGGEFAWYKDPFVWALTFRRINDANS